VRKSIDAEEPVAEEIQKKISQRELEKEEGIIRNTATSLLNFTALSLAEGKWEKGFILCVTSLGVSFYKGRSNQSFIGYLTRDKGFNLCVT